LLGVVAHRVISVDAAPDDERPGVKRRNK